MYVATYLVIHQSSQPALSLCVANIMLDIVMSVCAATDRNLWELVHHLD